MGRRSFIGSCGAVLAAACVAPAIANAAPLPPPSRKGVKALSFLNLHTGEQLKRVYWAEGNYVPDALRDIDHVLRDHRTGETHRIDRSLLDLLHRLRSQLNTTEPFQIISGYRSPHTNEMLRRKGGGGVAKRSLHMDGMAIDVAMKGRSLGEVRQAALSLKAGGVGYYPKSGFVHVDIGKVRSW